MVQFRVNWIRTVRSVKFYQGKIYNRTLPAVRNRASKHLFLSSQLAKYRSSAVMRQRLAMKCRLTICITGWCVPIGSVSGGLDYRLHNRTIYPPSASASALLPVPHWLGENAGTGAVDRRWAGCMQWCGRAVCDGLRWVGNIPRTQRPSSHVSDWVHLEVHISFVMQVRIPFQSH